MKPLSAAERADLAALELAVEAGITSIATMIEAGKSLGTIRSRQLFRVIAPTWDRYVVDRFGISKRRADQIVSFATLHETLGEMGTQVPDLGEKAARPLAGLPADQLAAVVDEAAKAGPVTAATLIATARRRRSGKAKAMRPLRFRVPGWTIIATPNAKAAGGVQEALAAAMRQAEAATDQAGGEAA